MNPLTLQLFARLSLRAKIHHHLDRYEERYRTMLAGIERSEIAAYDDEATYAELEALKKDLLQIRFAGLRGPSP